MIKTKIFSFAVLFFSLFALTKSVVFAATPPSFSSCTSPSGSVIASFPDGDHGIVGDGSMSGSDQVFTQSGGAQQCFCAGSSGVQTNWWKIPSSMSLSEIDDYIKQGWHYVPDGSAWGLDQEPYLAKNSNFSCTGEVLGTSTTNGGGGGGGSNGPAQPPVCHDDVPTSAPTVTITNVGANTVTLSWTAVSPVTHYALYFQRISDGAEYGAPDIGNVTTYTITNIPGGANYKFQVFGVNGCAPGPRSGFATKTVPGGSTSGRPLGGGGQVLGTTVEVSPTPSPSPEVTPSPLGEVLGATAATCQSWKFYLPWILLVAQFLGILLLEYLRRGDGSWFKHLIAIIITIISIVLFYWLRDCPCNSGNMWLAWLCKWYWLVAVVLTILLKGFSYAFLDESEVKEDITPEKKSKK